MCNENPVAWSTIMEYIQEFVYIFSETTAHVSDVPYQSSNFMLLGYLV